MKKLFLLGAMVCALGMMTACDYALELWYTLDNQSGHVATVTFGDNKIDVANGETKDAMISDDRYGGMNSTKEEVIDNTRRCYGDSVVMVFDQNLKVVYYASDSLADGPYDFNSNKYKCIERDVRMYGKTEHCFTNMVYTITEEDYNRAQ